MPRTKEQFKEMQNERKASILAAALPLFSLSKKVTIDAICEKADCSHGIVYRYFKNVDEVEAELFKTSLYLDLQQKILFAQGSNYEKIEQILGVFLDISVKEQETIHYLNILLKRKEKDSPYAILVQLIKNGQSSGSIVGGEPSDIVDSIYFLLKGLYLTILLEKHPDIKVPSVETVMQLLRKPTSFSRQIL